MKKLLGCTVAILVLFSGGVLAAEDEYSSTLEDMKGDVLVNAGQEYKKAQLKQRLKEDYLILIKKDEWFEISYDNGCDERIEGPKIYTVDADACGIVPWFAGVGASNAAALGWGGALIVCGLLCDNGGGGGGGDGTVPGDDEDDEPVSP